MIQKGYCILFILFLLSGFACGDLGQTSEERTDEATDELNELHREAAQRWCDCYADDDQYSRCMEDQYQSFYFSDCQRTVTTCYVDDYEDHLDCERDAIEEFRYCLSECSGARRSCIDDYRRDQDNCFANISVGLRNALVSCDLGANLSCW